MKAKKKKLDFTVRPRSAQAELPPDAETWVRGETPQAVSQKEDGPQVPQKRLTLNLPADLHKAFKGQCVREGVTIQEKVHSLIEDELAREQPTTSGHGRPPL